MQGSNRIYKRRYYIDELLSLFDVGLLSLQMKLSIRKYYKDEYERL